MYQFTNLINQSYPNVFTVQNVFQGLLKAIVAIRKLNDILKSQPGVGADTLRSLIGGLEAQTCSWVSCDMYMYIITFIYMYIYISKYMHV